MRSVLLKILKDGAVEKTKTISEKTLSELVTIDDWSEDAVDVALDVLAGDMPGGFANSDGKIEYSFELIDDKR